MSFTLTSHRGANRNLGRFIPSPLKPLLAAPFENWRAWVGLGWTDVVQNYRRTMLGPFWITMNLVIFTTAMTLVYGALFGVAAADYAGYVVCGMMAWLWASALISEVGNTFITYSSYIRSVPVDKAIFIWASVFKLLIVFAHNMIIFPVLLLFGIIKFSPHTLFIFPAIAILFLLSVPITAVTSILFARYRDLPRLIGTSTVIFMMLTPIFWKPDMVSGWRTAVVYLNPIHYVIEFLRKPLLGEPIGSLELAVVLGMTAALWVIATIIYRKYQAYVVFWV
ncbi:MAG TPA: ABC transporter permease [Pseudolabrys sp.]|nr:ABC transporter permease [Pseudolabrys sp.]